MKINIIVIITFVVLHLSPIILKHYTVMNVISILLAYSVYTWELEFYILLGYLILIP